MNVWGAFVIDSLVCGMAAWFIARNRIIRLGTWYLSPKTFAGGVIGIVFSFLMCVHLFGAGVTVKNLALGILLGLGIGYVMYRRR